jgi:hypothetical protein
MRVGRGAMRVLTALMVSMAVTGSASAQSAVIRGRIVDEQGRAVSGATVTLTNPRTGFKRTDDSDSEGLYRFAGLLTGLYDIRASCAGFTTVEQPATIIEVEGILHLDLTLRVAAVAETVNIVAPSPLMPTASPVVGGVVEPRRIEELPLNGRQFANLAATLPGVGIAFHRDPTKGTQYTPQVVGGAGRNVNYQVDGGDNNDDTVGGQLQMFPLDAIEEFRFSLASFAAESGRTSGGVMNVVTKSGTNHLSGSGFVFFRDEAMNARTTTESRLALAKSDYRRWQYGGSAGGPIRRNRAHFFGAAELVRQDTSQAVDTQGLFPSLDGVFPVEYREILLTGKATVNLRDADHAWLRYGLNTTSQPAGVGPRVPPQSWGDSDNTFHSINGRYARMLGGSAINELTFQYATFLNIISANATASREIFPNGVMIGQGSDIPQSTKQQKVHVRNDVSMHLTGGGGLGHAVKSGVAVGHDPFLGLPGLSETPGFFSYSHLTNDPRGPLTRVVGNTRTDPLASPTLETPLTQVGVYVQDDWRVTDRLTVNAGLRYDLAIGYQIDQSKNPNFAVVQSAAQAGRFANVIGMEDFGKTPRNDYDNVQPRVGLALDVNGQGKDVVRGGWGIYTDMAYTNANILFPAFDAQGFVSTGQFEANNPNGLRNPDGSFFTVGDPISNIAALNEGGRRGLLGEVVSPRLRQPYARQASFGWSHQLGAWTSFSADVIHSDGRDLNVRARLNSRPGGGPRRFADLALDPNTANFKVVISPLRSNYNALLLSLRRRSATGLDFALSYTLAKARSELGQGVDETGLGMNTIQDATDPFAPVQYGPAASDARHLVSLSAIVPLLWQLQVAPLFHYRSALPVFITDGVDRNNDFNNNDIPERAFAFDGVGEAPKNIGPCVTINCGRGAGSSQFNLRVSRQCQLRGSRLTVIAEGFNLFNASNPAAFIGRRLLGTAQSSSPNPDFLQPTSFSGDFQQPVQRIGQVALRWSF